MSGTTVTTEVLMPGLAEDMRSGTIVAWLAGPGAWVTAGDELFEVETDKATMTVQAEATGTLQIIAPVGATVDVGDVIARIGDAGPELELDTGAAAAPSTEADGAPAEEMTAPSVSPGASGGYRASPVARRVAGVHDVDLAAVEGTGPGGRIIRADVERSAGVEVTSNGAAAAAPGPAASASTAPTPPARASGERERARQGAR